MNVFTMVACIVVACTLCEAYKHRMKAKSRETGDGKKMAIVIRQMERLEERMANIETIVLERERHWSFDRSLAGNYE